jgi:Predicted membrane protein
MDINPVLRVIFGLLGLFLSIYSIHVEVSAHADKSYKAMCDISKTVSCTKVFLSKHGKGFGLVAPVLGEESILNLPNPVFGVVFYSLVIVISLFGNGKRGLQILTLLSALSCLMSMYLASILYQMKDICVVCFSTYLVNCVLFYTSFKRYNEYNVLEKYGKTD